MKVKKKEQETEGRHQNGDSQFQPGHEKDPKEEAIPVARVDTIPEDVRHKRTLTIVIGEDEVTQFTVESYPLNAILGVPETVMFGAGDEGRGQVQKEMSKAWGEGRQKKTITKIEFGNRREG